MRGLARRARGLAARRRVASLPQDDGLIPVMMVEATLGCTKHWIELVPPARMHEHCSTKMKEHDARNDVLRWGGNQWGEQWVEQPALRDRFARQIPLLATDLNLTAWRRALREIGA